MAERRMFSQRIIGSARFLRMPIGARLLYYDLGMYADDDGVVEAFTVMQMTHAAEEDLRMLVARGFVQLLNEDLVAFISDWKRNNMIRRDRYTPSMYQALLPCGQAEAEGGMVVNPVEEREGEEKTGQSSGERKEGEASPSDPADSGDIVSVKGCFEEVFGRKPDRSFLASMRRMMQEGMGAEEIGGLIRQSVHSRPRKPEAYILAVVEKRRKEGGVQEGVTKQGGDAPLAEWEKVWLAQVQRKREAFGKSLEKE